MMLLESGVALGTIKALKALPDSAQSVPTAYFLSVRARWVGTVSSVLLNLVYWVLWLGVSYPIFFCKKPAEVMPMRR